MSYSSIIQRTISGTPQKSCALNGSCFSRPISLPANWLKIRVGIRYHATDYGASLFGKPRLSIGFCSNQTSIMGTAVTTNGIGLHSVASSGNWTRSATNYSLGSVHWYGYTRVGSTYTLSAADISSTATCVFGNGAASATADRTVLMCDITKGSPNYTVNGMLCNNSAVADVSQATFLAQMLIDPPVIAQHVYGNTPQAMAFSEVPGSLNAVNVWFNRQAINVELEDLAVTVLSTI